MRLFEDAERVISQVVCHDDVLVFGAAKSHQRPKFDLQISSHKGLRLGHRSLWNNFIWTLSVFSRTCVKAEEFSTSLLGEDKV